MEGSVFEYAGLEDNALMSIIESETDDEAFERFLKTTYMSVVIDRHLEKWKRGINRN